MSNTMQRVGMAAMAVACLLVVGMAQAQPVAEKPKFALGDRWEFKGRIEPDGKPNDAVRTIVEFAASNLLKVRQQDGRVTEYDAAMNFMPGGSNPRLLVRYPLKVGDEWELNRQIDARGTVETGKAKVVAYESIRVPAGTFQCYRVEAVTNLSNGPYREDRIWKRWYCPDVKFIARESIDTTIVNPSNPAAGGHKVLTSELVSFTPGK